MTPTEYENHFRIRASLKILIQIKLENEANFNLILTTIEILATRITSDSLPIVQGSWDFSSFPFCCFIIPLFFLVFLLSTHRGERNINNPNLALILDYDL